ncbi:unnamed protein product, partial [Brenthis ino]
MSIGKIAEFNIRTDNWRLYVERLEQYFIVNKIASELKVPTLITVVGLECYELLVDLCTPDKPSSKTFEQLTNTAKRVTSSKYCEVFAEGLGRFTGGAASIHIREGARPVFMRARPLAYALRGPVERALDQMVRDGILTPVERSDWATPIVPVMKKDGGVPRDLQLGDQVMARGYGGKDKWLDGTVIGREGSQRYIVESGNGQRFHRHIDQIKRKSRYSVAMSSASDKEVVAQPDEKESLELNTESAGSRICREEDKSMTDKRAEDPLLIDSCPSSSCSPPSPLDCPKRQRKLVLRYGIDT